MNKRIKTIWEKTTKTCIPREGDYVSRCKHCGKLITKSIW